MKMTESQKSPRRRGVFAVTPCKWGKCRAGLYRPCAGLCRCARHRLQPCHDLSPGRSPGVGGARSLPALSWPLRYRLLCRAAGGGHYPEAELETYGSDDSRLPMSGMATYTPGMEMSGGSLGQAVHCRRHGAWAAAETEQGLGLQPMSDGELDEGSTWRQRCRRLTMA